jgi:hypothetical protein
MGILVHRGRVVHGLRVLSVLSSLKSQGEIIIGFLINNISWGSDLVDLLVALLDSDIAN